MIEICCVVAVICCLVIVCIQQNRINDLTEVVSQLVEHKEINMKLWSIQISANENVFNMIKKLAGIDDKEKKDD